MVKRKVKVLGNTLYVKIKALALLMSSHLLLLSILLSTSVVFFESSVLLSCFLAKG